MTKNQKRIENQIEKYEDQVAMLEAKIGKLTEKKEDIEFQIMYLNRKTKRTYPGDFVSDYVEEM